MYVILKSHGNGITLAHATLHFDELYGGGHGPSLHFALYNNRTGAEFWLAVQAARR